MNKKEWKEYYSGIRKEARKQAGAKFEEHPEALTVMVPWIQPFYETTPENLKLKADKQLSNAMAEINGEEPPYPEEDGISFIEVRRT